jgi:hypothetical protein
MIVCSFLPAKIADASFQCLSSVGSFCSFFLYFALPLLKKKPQIPTGIVIYTQQRTGQKKIKIFDNVNVCSPNQKLVTRSKAGNFNRHIFG